MQIQFGDGCAAVKLDSFEPVVVQLANGQQGQACQVNFSEIVLCGIQLGQGLVCRKIQGTEFIGFDAEHEQFSTAISVASCKTVAFAVCNPD